MLETRSFLACIWRKLKEAILRQLSSHVRDSRVALRGPATRHGETTLLEVDAPFPRPSPLSFHLTAVSGEGNLMAEALNWTTAVTPRFDLKKPHVHCSKLLYFRVALPLYIDNHYEACVKG